MPVTCLTHGWCDPETCLLSIYFAPELLAQARDAISPADRDLLDECSQDGPWRLFEHLRECDRSFMSVMHYVAHHICAGVDDTAVVRGTGGFLCGRLLADHWLAGTRLQT